MKALNTGNKKSMVKRDNYLFIVSRLFLTLYALFFQNGKSLIKFWPIFPADEYKERFIFTTFHKVINLAKDLILSLKYLYAYEPSHKRNCTTVKMPCTAKVEIT